MPGKIFFIRYVRTFVFIIASTTKVINEYRLINVVSQPRIEPGTFRFQDDHETHYAAEAVRCFSVSWAGLPRQSGVSPSVGRGCRGSQVFLRQLGGSLIARNHLTYSSVGTKTSS